MCTNMGPMAVVQSVRSCLDGLEIETGGCILHFAVCRRRQMPVGVRKQRKGHMRKTEVETELGLGVDLADGHPDDAVGIDFAVVDQSSQGALPLGCRKSLMRVLVVRLLEHFAPSLRAGRTLYWPDVLRRLF